MIERLFEIEEKAKSDNPQSSTRVMAIKSLKSLLLKLDAKSEWVPFRCRLQLIDLLEDLKGERLNEAELSLVNEMLDGEVLEA